MSLPNKYVLKKIKDYYDDSEDSYDSDDDDMPFLQIYDVLHKESSYAIRTPCFEINFDISKQNIIPINPTMGFYDFLKKDDDFFNSVNFRTEMEFENKCYLPIIENYSFKIYFPLKKDLNGSLNFKIYNYQGNQINFKTFDKMCKLNRVYASFIIKPYIFVKLYEYKVVFRVIFINLKNS